MSDDRLRLLVERIERISEEIKGLQEDRRDVFAEAKAVGYSAATLRRVIARRKMSPSDRFEADSELQAYEAALSMDAAPAPPMAPEAAELAHALLAAQIEGIGDPERARLVVEHVLFLLDLRAEIAALRAQESARKKLATGEGFEAKHIHATVRWFEKCAKHGEDLMRAGEATFNLYRSTVETRDLSGDAHIGDDKLRALFAPPPPKAAPKRSRNLQAMMENARAARRALGE